MNSEENWELGSENAIQSNEDLIREIKELHKLVDLYHYEAQRRKTRYIGTIG